MHTLFAITSTSARYLTNSIIVSLSGDLITKFLAVWQTSRAAQVNIHERIHVSPTETDASCSTCKLYRGLSTQLRRHRRLAS